MKNPHWIVGRIALGSFTLALTASAQNPPRMLTVTRDVRFGATDGTAAELVLPSVLAPAPDGHLVVYDARDHQIKEYDPKGQFLRAIGRSGAGPGEFNDVTAMGWLGDTLWAADYPLRRVTLFPPPDRRHPITLPIQYSPKAAAVGDGTVGAMLRGGVVLVQGLAQRFYSGPISSPVASPVVRMRRNATMLDTVAKPVVRVVGDISLPTGTFIQPFAPPRGFWVARSDGRGFVVIDAPAPATSAAFFTIARYDSTGKRVASERHAYTAVPLTNAVRDSAVKLFTKALKPEERQRFRAGLYLPQFLPTVNRVLAGNDGSVFIDREWYVPDYPRWDVFDSGGTIIGSVRQPKGFRMLYADRTQLLGLEQDSDGVWWALRYRISP